MRDWPAVPPSSRPGTRYAGHTHPQTEVVRPDGEHVLVDEQIAPLLTALWDAGVVTLHSCQNVLDSAPERPGDRDTWPGGRAWLVLPSLDDVLRLLSLAGTALSGEREQARDSGYWARLPQTVWAPDDEWRVSPVVTEADSPDGHGVRDVTVTVWRVDLPADDIRQAARRVARAHTLTATAR